LLLVYFTFTESDIPISIDTRRAHVAKVAVGAGADIVNDVSGGMFDPTMLATVAELGVPIVMMHIRGTPETMQSMTEYDDVVYNVAASLNERSQAAESAGIQRWMQVLDPGIGFAKDLQGNLLLLKSMPEIRSITGNVPLLLGTSRKGFIGKLSGVADPKDRDPGTVASTVAAICISEQAGSCNIVRVHNVAAVRQGTIVMDAILKAK
jgi:dihydropteroate synthase